MPQLRLLLVTGDVAVTVAASFPTLPYQ